jgi:outer membrane receptor protein involved in Fe transport
LFRVLLFSVLGCGAVSVLRAEPQGFDIPAESGAAALLEFSQQAKVEVLFSSEAMSGVTTQAVNGRYEPSDALDLMLRGTHFIGKADRHGNFVIKEVAIGSIRGRLLTPDGRPAQKVHVYIPSSHRLTTTDDNGEFHFDDLPAGQYELIASEAGYLPLRMPEIRVEGRRHLKLDTQTIRLDTDAQALDPFVIEEKASHPGLFDHGETALPPRTAVGNLDLPRSENDALPYTIYDRRQIMRSGVVTLNEYMQRELLDGNAGTLPPEQNGNAQTFVSSSSNLALRGYTTQETVILVNGRRLPQILTVNQGAIPPDVNFIPLSLVERIEVLPASASALYSGNPVGGVINIVLRPGADARSTEVTTTYTNGFKNDAPESSASLVHSESFLGGALRLRFSANFTKAEPPSEAQLRYHQVYDSENLPLDQAVYRATPNIRSADLSPLFGPGSSPVTSVAPGADGQGGIAAFDGRQGVRDFDFYNTPGGYSSSLDSVNYGYGREQTRSAYYGSVVYDAFPWLQLGFDGTYSHMQIDRGFDLFRGDLTLAANSPYNPFHQDIDISLNETAPALGENYSEAHLDFGYAVIGALVKFPADWRGSIDAQFGKNITRYRGVADVDQKRWQRLVDQGIYNPLRDTQTSPPPKEFYDQVLEYEGGRNQFVTLGNFDTIDVAARATNESLKLPTGVSTINVGADYRRDHLDSFVNQVVYGDGSPAQSPVMWQGRTLQQYSVFGEFQAPLLSQRWLPSWLHKVETDSAVRYLGSASSNETNVAPTFGLKIDFAGGFSLRGSVTTTNRFPSPVMSSQVGNVDILDNQIVPQVLIVDPLRVDANGKNSQYSVIPKTVIDPHLRPEAAVTQTGGIVYQKGRDQRLRVSVDFVDTHKVNELYYLDAPTVVALENIFPDRVIRLPKGADDTQKAGVISTVLVGETNLAWRHSQNWNISFDYAMDHLWSGTLEVYQRSILFTTYDRQATPSSSLHPGGVVDELNSPDDPSLDLLRYRSNFGVAWYKPIFGIGLDGHYYSSRKLDSGDASLQGSDHIDSYWQFDAYVQTDLTHWLWQHARFGLTAQLRVNNFLNSAFPRYDAESTGSGVEPYGDWRGRVYSVSCTATF